MNNVMEPFFEDHAGTGLASAQSMPGRALGAVLSGWSGVSGAGEVQNWDSERSLQSGGCLASTLTLTDWGFCTFLSEKLVKLGIASVRAPP